MWCDEECREGGIAPGEILGGGGVEVFFSERYFVLILIGVLVKDRAITKLTFEEVTSADIEQEVLAIFDGLPY